MTRSEVLNAAKKCVCEERDHQYGAPEDNFGRIASLWSDYKGETFTPKDVSVMMILVKVARLAGGDCIDNYVDIAGYAACGGELAEKNVAAETKKHFEIYKVPYRHGKHIIENGKEHAPREKFYFTNGNVWVGVDNSTGDLWVEEFITEKGCIAWLEGNFAADELKDELKEENE